ncbi:MAG: AAA family ATPase, partial [Paludibacteraceae bacterium]|nr:AAA family ATPase [Paludibacteraceae bacterium]
MLKRKFTQRLQEWKERKQKECLLVCGARQIGKTYIIDFFGKTAYKNYIYINFEERPELKKIFEDDLSVDAMVQKISLYLPSAVFEQGNTLLFLDEIQSCPQARTSLKFWALDNRYDVIASGSLLGINYKEVSSFPVGYERQVTMHALDFEEFLWAMGIGDEIIAMLRRHFEMRTPVDGSVHTKMMKFLREYMIVGGMPAVVNKYQATHLFNEVYEEQKKILNTYLNDMGKYAPNTEQPKIRSCYLSIPRQLAKENTKFQYSVVEKGGTTRKFGNAIDWLRDADLVLLCHNVSTITFPLTAYTKTEQYRIYLSDIGLLTAMYGMEMKKAVFDDTLKGAAKGGIYENLVADMLTAAGVDRIITM